MIPVFIADDHSLVRAGLRRLLSDSPDIEVVGEAASANEMLERVEETAPEIVLLDISMPGPGLLETVRELRERGIKVLVLSMHPEGQFAARALKAGASGYLTKERSPGELIGALHRVHEGRTYISFDFAEALATGLAVEEPPHERLSEREFEVLVLLASGHTVSDISRQLALSPKTVSTYRSRVLEKLDLQHTADLVRYAIEHHLV